MERQRRVSVAIGPADTEFQKIHKRGSHFPTSPRGAIKR